jgi:hypothetical protein
VRGRRERAEVTDAADAVELLTKKTRWFEKFATAGGPAVR